MTIYLLDLFGVFVFALSGAMAAERRRMDLLGFVVIALLPALGAAKALSLGHSAVIAVFMGVMTGVVGGIVRDVVCNEVPLILRQDVYATAAFAGAVCYALLVTATPLSDTVAIWIGAAVCFAVRAAALTWNLSLPRRGEGPPDA